MNYRYIFLATAQEEYESSVNWYIGQSLHATENFIDAVDVALGLICEYPDRWRNEFGEYYEINVKKYPYSIVYTIDTAQQLVVVTSLYHHSRDPQKKYKK